MQVHLFDNLKIYILNQEQNFFHIIIYYSYSLTTYIMLNYPYIYRPVLMVEVYFLAY